MIMTNIWKNKKKKTNHQPDVEFDHDNFDHVVNDQCSIANCQITRGYHNCPH